MWSGKESDTRHAQILASLLEPDPFYQLGVQEHSVPARNVYDFILKPVSEPGYFVAS
jgi:hypothetical protein